ncbi:MAG: metallophosphoesterase, partial [Clostridia bacterium]|nr:metallophosphoesterase [Clostridia bacterium]
MVYITGDMHGDYKRFDSPALKKLKKGDTLIVCGDFGFIWDNSKREHKILKKLGNKKYNICFIDGTHENFELLNAYPVSMWNGGKVHNICGNLFHMMRGQIFRIDNMTFFTMGGGESPDIDIRFEENAWSKDEFPSREELLEGAANLEKLNCRIDYVVT